MKKRTLFNSEDFKVKIPLPTVPLCGVCGLSKTCKSPKMPYTGLGKKKILIIAEAPGSTEDDENKQLVGKTGRFLEDELKTLGINMRSDCWLTNAIICRPPDNKIPTPKVIDYCRPNAIKTIKELKPNQILLLGSVAVKSVLGWLWKESPGSINRWLGVCIPHRELNSWISVAWHPSFVIRKESYDDEIKESEKHIKIKKTLWLEQLRNIITHKEKPYDTIPNINKHLKVFFNSNDAIPHLNKFLYDKTPIAFDFETNTLKPDSIPSKIICCSVSNGEISIAYPWLGEAVTKTKELLESDIPKIGYNCKFENRHSLKIGIKVNNWVWDGMIAAHVLDNRREFCSLKFQSFINFGVEDYSTGMEPYFKSNSSNTLNRIKEVDLKKLLTYCAIDSYLEFQMAKLQSEKLGINIGL